MDCSNQYVGTWDFIAPEFSYILCYVHLPIDAAIRVVDTPAVFIAHY